MIKEIISRLTMSRETCAFVDNVSGKEVFYYTDCYGDRWLAEFGFIFSTRVKIEDNQQLNGGE